MEQTSSFFEDFSPYCDLDLEDKNPNFLHNTPGYDDTPTYQVSLSGSEDIVNTNYIFPQALNPHCDLDLEHSNTKLSHVRLLMMHHYTTFGCKRFRGLAFEDLICDLDHDFR